MLSPAIARRCGSAPTSPGVRRQPAQHRDHVLDAGRRRMLGRQPVVHRQHLAAGARGQLPAHVVVRIEVADHATAAMRVEAGWRGTGVEAVRAVQAQRNRRGRTRCLQVANLGHLRARETELRGDAAHHRPRLGQGQFLHRRLPGLLRQGEETDDVWIEIHGWPSRGSCASGVDQIVIAHNHFRK
ncbi:hypothetical protein QE400_000953 [Xanthomonas sacchari]|nr:hypothetical protein [Xanthomonas sacchari]